MSEQKENSSSEPQTLTVQQAIDFGIKHHNAGRLPKAEKIYQQILQANPNQPVVLHLLGVIAYQMKKYDIAVNLIGKSLAIKPDYAEAHSNLGLALKEQGKLDDAVTSHRKAIAFKPNYAEAYSNLGNALKDQGKLEDAVSSYRKAIAIKPDYDRAYYNLGNALQVQGILDEAVASYRKVITIKPNPEAYYNLSVVLQDQGKFDDAVTNYRKAIAIKPDYAEAYSNLGLALKDQGKLDDAVASYRKAIAIKPDCAEAYSNLGNALKEQGKLDDAFTCHRRAVALDRENDNFWAGLAKSMGTLPFTSVDDSLLQDLMSLTEQPSVRPSLLVRPIISALLHNRDFSQICQLAGAKEPDRIISYGKAAAQLSTMPLFLRIMGLTHITDLKIEQMLTVLRHAMLQETMAGTIKENGLPFATALALQCFTNEYVYPETGEEKIIVEHLQKQIAELVEQKQNVPSSLITTLGAYRPLYKFPWAKKLADPEWGSDICAVVERQISEPYTELSLRSQFTTLTPLQDTVSQLVREQYEENPYPRWFNIGSVDKGKPIGTVLRGLQFDIGGYQSPESPEILIAGCGTGHQTLATAMRFKDARILAVDLSLSSLSYAKRKTDELGLLNIEYAQADILKLNTLERQFDFIECAGVLHHLGEPLVGWQKLVDLLRPGGIMKIGLYSETARQSIVKGRTMIIEKGYAASLEDIRQCRQDIIAMAEGGHMEMIKICHMRDFFSISECRDLLFHVQEHRFTLPQIKSALNSLKLKFLGFEMSEQNAIRKFKEIYPKKNALTSLSLWHKFELKNPDTFMGMYQFWCRKM